MAALYVYAVQERVVYAPDRLLRATPAEAGLPYEDVLLTAEDGVGLHGWWVPHPEPRGTLLFAHGNAGNVSDRLDSLRLFHELGLATLIVDYRGYGRSEGRPSEAGTYRDIAAAWRHLVETRGADPARTVLLGRSLGGPIAAWLAARVRPAGLVLEGTFTSLVDMARLHYPWLPVRWLARIRYDTLASVRRLADVPLLVVHSVDDAVVPCAFGRALYRAAPPPKRFLALHGPHAEAHLASLRRYRAGLERFLAETLGG